MILSTFLQASAYVTLAAEGSGLAASHPATVLPIVTPCAWMGSAHVVLPAMAKAAFLA
jgi:hypothetical protein